MKHLALSLSASILLLGCQTTQEQRTADEFVVSNTIATPVEINQALLVDESIDVIHPVADVEIDLDQDKIHVSEDIWQHIRGKLTFDVPQNKRVISQRNWYVKHPNYLDRVAKRAEPFLFYIVQELEKANIPLEIALLPIVESAFDPFAYSHGRASGMWQFVPGTGKRFGMKQNWWYDGRRDVVASTQGAIKYLKYLNKYFDGDWLLALAAYNSGEGRVRRAMKNNARKNKPTDFWSLDLPKETRAYVPKLLALADIVKQPEQFSLKLYEIDNTPVIATVDIKSQLDLAKAARLADLSLAEFQRLNPGFNRWATDPEGPHYLLLPNAKIEKFEEGLAKLSDKDRLSWQRYKIKNGDSLIRIAKKFHTTPELIRKVNNISGNNIRAGKHLLIPVAAQALDDYILSQEQRLTKTQQRRRNGVKTMHKVKSGDTLWDISRKYNVSTRSIAKWNGMAPKDYIKPGQNLVIWQKVGLKQAAQKRDAQAIMRNITYRVRRGDSFARIADKFNVKISDIERWNSLSRKEYLQPGQMLKLSVDVTNSI
ncbi:LysM peptidoglycan-binding domain-containing protein [Thalassotalea sp. M1531]|uniref:LysM peptidoglycan-binding domain-containing protein n=1 Tax=Thalassotalea algicola TaxID=2716224 RepID=A0A7Y0LC62_9GAMM|nr:LysM peptidoglycan-binding domain-containing protein [Thalassotalea algicola]NMP31478.1 LysM peptidoglycan-binding domain-containing protein [Thalassotalea algicola]